MNNCFSTLLDIINNGRSCVLVTVAHIAGSAPREAGARMIVTHEQVFGTIGGGNLEFEAIRISRTRLDEPSATGPQRFIELFPLGSMLQQCCGGAVFLHFEVLNDGPADWISAAGESEQNNARALFISRHSDTGREPGIDKMIFTEAGSTGSLGDKGLDELASTKAKMLLSANGAVGTALLHPMVESKSTLPDISDALFFEVVSTCHFQVVLFGAGHVGRALVSALAGATDCRITWVDSRAEQFPETNPPNVQTRLTDNPVAEIGGLPAGAYCLVMTHNHQLDQDLCEALLRRDDFAYLGLIGSATKYRRFMQRFSEKGISKQQMDRLTCPIGLPGIDSKEPGVIAISVAAQLLSIQTTG